jgi:hypothetical protein
VRALYGKRSGLAFRILGFALRLLGLGFGSTGLGVTGLDCGFREGLHLLTP